MKKVFRVENLDCANCAAKMESAVRKIDGVTSATLNYMMMKLTVEAPDDQMDRVAEETVKVCRKMNPECRLLG